MDHRPAPHQDRPPPSAIVNDPNRAGDPQYILRLLGKVISLSLETVQIVAALPELGVSVEEDAVPT